ncbi:unnamed protein product [Spirodela intermedia]|uniref:Oleosin n=1 Tax=Spirodela intermedia TaxID=51605 RepID=A0A7I8JU85_SPIIN|nr:unnamed protein product [Spirodela intermedia]CAA6673746.1 unnamed protein product [Spirodela intermedia]
MAEQQQQQRARGAREAGEEAAPSHGAAKAVGAATAGGSMLLLSGLILAGTVVGLTLATPLLVIFSPVLLPAAAAAVLIAVGFVSAGGLALTALSVLSWIYRYAAGKHPPGAEQLEQARLRLAGKAHDVKERLEHRVEHAEHHS